MFALSIDNGIARLRISRPEARNAIPVDGWTELAERAEEASAAARVLIVEGDVEAFCSGADLNDFSGFRSDPAARFRFRSAMRQGLDRLSAIPIPTIALVEAACYGAGVALAMACDVRIAGPAARFAITPAKFGIIYPQEDVHRLVGLVGPGQARRLLLAAEAIDASEAQRIGLVEILSLDAPGSAATLAGTMAANDPAALTALKHSVALAERGTRMDAAQDGLFDDHLGSTVLFQRLEGRRSAKD